MVQFWELLGNGQSSCNFHRNNHPDDFSEKIRDKTFLKIKFYAKKFPVAVDILHLDSYIPGEEGEVISTEMSAKKGNLDFFNCLKVWTI